MPPPIRDLGIDLLIGIQALLGWIFKMVRQRPHQSLAAALLLILLLVAPRSNSAPAPNRANSVPMRDKAAAVLPRAFDPAGRKTDRGWWVQDGQRLSSAWMALLIRARQAGWHGHIKSGIRTRAEQAQLYRLFLRGQGAPAFRPDGPSRHLERHVIKRGGWSQAVDVKQPEALIRIADHLGVELDQPYPDEPWHLEARQPFYATQLIGR